ncbi:hypothetical protein ACQY0O_003863 [Thecaphora frezii]
MAPRSDQHRFQVPDRLTGYQYGRSAPAPAPAWLALQGFEPRSALGASQWPADIYAPEATRSQSAHGAPLRAGEGACRCRENGQVFCGCACGNSVAKATAPWQHAGPVALLPTRWENPAAPSPAGSGDGTTASSLLQQPRVFIHMADSGTERAAEAGRFEQAAFSQLCDDGAQLQRHQHLPYGLPSSRVGWSGGDAGDSSAAPSTSSTGFVGESLALAPESMSAALAPLPVAAPQGTSPVLDRIQALCGPGPTPWLAERRSSIAGPISSLQPAGVSAASRFADDTHDEASRRGSMPHLFPAARGPKDVNVDTWKSGRLLGVSTGGEGFLSLQELPQTFTSQAASSSSGNDNSYSNDNDSSSSSSSNSGLPITAGAPAWPQGPWTHPYSAATQSTSTLSSGSGSIGLDFGGQLLMTSVASPTSGGEWPSSSSEPQADEGVDVALRSLYERYPSTLSRTVQRAVAQPDRSFTSTFSTFRDPPRSGACGSGAPLTASNGLSAAFPVDVGVHRDDATSTATTPQAHHARFEPFHLNTSSLSTGMTMPSTAASSSAWPSRSLHQQHVGLVPPPPPSSSLSLSPSPTSLRHQPFATDEARWAAMQSRSHAADRVFLYGALTTKIVCKPSCASKRPERHRVRFFANPGAAEAAMAAGYRPCKRCKPHVAGTSDQCVVAVGECVRHITRAAYVASVGRGDVKRQTLKEYAAMARLSPFHFHRTFKAVSSVTPGEYAKACHTLALQDTLGLDAHGCAAGLDAATIQVALRSWSVRRARRAVGGVSPSAYASGCRELSVFRTAVTTRFGEVAIAFTESISESEKMVCKVYATLLGLGAGERVARRFPHSNERPDREAWLANIVDDLAASSDREVQLPDDVHHSVRRARIWIAVTRSLARAGSESEVGEDEDEDTGGGTDTANAAAERFV